MDGPDGISWLRFLVASASVLALLGVLSLGLRWAAARGWGGVALAGLRRGGRLSLIESLPLDGRRRLVLIRCDATESLLLLGAQTEHVVLRRLRGGASFEETEGDSGAADSSSIPDPGIASSSRRKPGPRAAERAGPESLGIPVFAGMTRWIRGLRKKSFCTVPRSPLGERTTEDAP